MSKSLTLEIHEYDNKDLRIILEVKGQKKPFLIAYSKDGIFDHKFSGAINTAINEIQTLVLTLASDEVINWSKLTDGSGMHGDNRFALTDEVPRLPDDDIFGGDTISNDYLTEKQEQEDKRIRQMIKLEEEEDKQFLRDLYDTLPTDPDIH